MVQQSRSRANMSPASKKTRKAASRTSRRSNSKGRRSTGGATDSYDEDHEDLHIQPIPPELEAHMQALLDQELYRQGAVHYKNIGQGASGSVYMIGKDTVTKCFTGKAKKKKMQEEEVIFKTIADLCKGADPTNCGLAQTKECPVINQVWADKKNCTQDARICMPNHGISLHNWVEEDRFQAMQRVFVARKLIRIIHTIHEKGIYHRDIKPDNIAISEEESRVHVTLIDVGTIKFREGLMDHMNQTFHLGVGTPLYMHPLCIISHLFIDELGKLHTLNQLLQIADWWSCGVTLLQLFLGMGTQVIHLSSQIQKQFQIIFQSGNQYKNYNAQMGETIQDHLNKLHPEWSSTIAAMLGHCTLETVGDQLAHIQKAIGPILINS